MVERGVAEYLEEHEIKAILDSPYRSNIRDRLILRILASTGVRVSELLSITWKDIILTPGQEFVRVYTLKKRKKDKDGNLIRKREVRVIPIDDSLLINLLEKYRPDNYNPNEPLFDLKRQSVTAMVKRYGERAGIKKNVYSHIFRHSYAVHRLNNGLDLRTLQILLGHSNLNQTAIYLQLTARDTRRALEKSPLGW